VHLDSSEHGRCGHCGTRRSDWLTDDGRQLVEPAYVAEIVDCPGCRRLAEARDSDEAKPAWKHVQLRPATIADWV
jgi:hypothetical protein